MELLVEVAGAQVAARRGRRVPAPGRAHAHHAAGVAGERGARHRARRGRRVGRARAARHRARQPCRTDGDAGDTVVAIVPTFRPDLDREIDLVEEVARRIGFDRIGRTLPDTHGQVGALTAASARAPPRGRRAGRGGALGGDHPVAGGARRPRARRRAARPAGAGHQPAAVRGVGAAHRGAPRPAPRAGGQPQPGPGRRRAVRDGPRVPRRPPATVAADAGPLPDEPEQVAFAWAGPRAPPPGRGRPPGRRATTRSTRCARCSTRSASPTSRSTRSSITGFRAGRAARVLVSGVEAGTVGEVAPAVLDALNLEAPVVAAELVLDTLLDAPRRDRTFRAPSRFPASLLDLAFVADDVGRRREHRGHAARRARRRARSRCAASTTSAPTRSAPGGAAWRSRCDCALPTAPSPTPRPASCAPGRWRAVEQAHGAELRG